MIPYYGLPASPQSVAIRIITGGHVFVSFKYLAQLGLALEFAQSFAVDNGAFSAWKSGNPVTDWEPYYEWVAELHRYPTFDFAVIPDVIDGDEAANDALIAQWPWRGKDAWVGAPVWHLHESLDRLTRLALEWPRVCLGSSGQYATVGTSAWYQRMTQAMDAVCDKSGRPVCKLHGLRMLNPDVFTRFPFASADSTSIAINTKLDSNWKGTYQPVTKESRVLVMRERIEVYQAQTFWDRKAAPIQESLFFSCLQNDEETT